MNSNDVIIEAPMSFIGSAKRLWRLSENIWIEIFLLIPLILLVWCLVLSWYLFFGVLLVPYRLIRRSQRAQKRDALRHEEVLRSLK
jgi:hypothetical protein